MVKNNRLYNRGKTTFCHQKQLIVFNFAQLVTVTNYKKVNPWYRQLWLLFSVHQTTRKGGQERHKNSRVPTNINQINNNHKSSDLGISYQK